MVILGSKGHAKEILNVFSYNEEDSHLHFFDNVSKSKEPMVFQKYPVLRSNEELRRYFKQKDNRFVLGVGNPKVREFLTILAESLGGQLNSVISQNAIIGKHETKIEAGVNIMHGVIINNSVSIGKACLINANVSIHHDCLIGDFSEISPAATITGRVQIGTHCSIGTGATILPDVVIGNNVIVGAGAVVTKSVESNVKIAGVPAKPI